MKRLDTCSLHISVDGLARGFLYLFFIISIFEPYLNELIGSMTKYYMFLVMLVFLYRDGFRLRLRRITLVYIVWLIYKIVTLLWSESFVIPKLHFISQVGMVLFLTILLSKDSEEKTLRGILDIYWLTSVALGVLALFFSEAYQGDVESRRVLVIMGVEVDPNNQAALLLVGIAISLSNIFYEKHWVVPSVLGLMINTFTCFATSSRAALVTAVALALFCVIYVPEKMKFKATAKRLLAMGLTVAAVQFVIIRYLPEASFARLFGFEDYVGGSRRDIIWGIAWNLWTEHPLTMLVGAGWGTAYVYLQGTAVHNTFLSMLCDVGLFGTSLFLVPTAYAAVKLMKKGVIAPVMLLAAQMIPAFFIDAINKRFFWNAVIILLLHYYMQSKKLDRTDTVAESPLPGEQV